MTDPLDLPPYVRDSLRAYCEYIRRHPGYQDQHELDLTYTAPDYDPDSDPLDDPFPEEYDSCPTS